jgi:anti-sigma factor RsiW
MYEPMSDLGSQLSDRELAELAALADGTLPADRRPEVEARVAASPELREPLERQRQSLALTAASRTSRRPRCSTPSEDKRARRE